MVARATSCVREWSGPHDAPIPGTAGDGWPTTAGLSLRGLVTGSQLAADLRDPEPGCSLRNLLVGPLAEEWVFRACMCPLLFGAGFSDGGSVFLSAVIFGAVRA